LKKTGSEFVVSEDQWLHDEDWVDCKDCLYRELGDCVAMEYNDGGCYSGEKMED
jgi:hypothetical protein